MIHNLKDCPAQVLPHVGGKAKNLIALMRAGFHVPSGIVIDTNVFDALLDKAGIKLAIEAQLKTLNDDNVTQVSQAIRALFAKLTFDACFKEQLSSLLDDNADYAVRSSALMEDQQHHSFAGMYDTSLNVRTVNTITQAIIRCYRSTYAEGVLQYVHDHKLPHAHLKMAVVIQQMVPAEFSGIAFTLNPTTGNDCQIVAELTTGLGEQLVGGYVTPMRYIYDWYQRVYCERPDANVLPTTLADQLMQTFLKITQHFGYPCDIEFAIAAGTLHILQTRPITKINYGGIDDVWSTADFKDGGVSSTTCTPMMWSLYEYVWNATLRRFIVDSKILPASDCQKPLGEMFYGRPYWNLSFVKKAMARIPGYCERDFDATYGIKSNYTGDGVRTGTTVKSLWRVVKIAFAQSRIVRTHELNAEDNISNFLARFNYYDNRTDAQLAEQPIERIWYQLTKEDYFKVESTYFWQIFINTIHQSLNKERLTKFISNSSYLGLMAGIDDISHLRPFYAMWHTSRKINRSADALNYWQKHTNQEIVDDIGTKKTEYYLNDVRQFIDDYGYHSSRELDITYPSYSEQRDHVVAMYKDTIAMSDQCNPQLDKVRQARVFKDNMDGLVRTVGTKKATRLQRVVFKMRKMLWWREEFRDVSTRFYHLVRQYTLQLANDYLQRGIIDNIQQIFMLKIEDLWRFIDGDIDRQALREIIARNSDYYAAYLNYMSENEIGVLLDRSTDNRQNGTAELRGLGCNSGTITGTARVIADLSQIDRIQHGDILVTKFTDTGWTAKFALLAGVVTEFGGVLCHAAIVSREYGIPCVVAAEGVVTKIVDGDTITVDGATGDIFIVERSRKDSI